MDEVNIQIREGETIAIVGGNGAGKSTLVKLLLGLYLPTGGDVFVGGCNTRDVSGSSIYRHCSSVFQDFQKYKMSLKNNMMISDINQPEDGDRMVNVLKEVGISVADSTYPDGLETMLAREFGGVDISGGQWQRSAIARGIYREHQIIVLDEPTAAIDPLEESKIYNQFAELSKQKTSIIITHRIGSAKIADRIIVMDGGKVVGNGTHEELINGNDLYKEMFFSQARWYE